MLKGLDLDRSSMTTDATIKPWAERLAAMEPGMLNVTVAQAFERGLSRAVAPKGFVLESNPDRER